MFYARVDTRRRCVVLQFPGSLCICVSSYSVNRLLNLLALKGLHWWLCVWWLFVKKDTLEADENTQVTSSCFSSESEIMYIFMHKMHWCNAFFSSVLLSFEHTLKQLCEKRTLSCFIVCVHHWMDCYITWRALGTGGLNKKNKDSKELLWVSSLCRECVWADYINLCKLQLLQREEDKEKNVSRGNRYRLRNIV